MKNKIYIIHGPNLNLVGVREPEIYGNMTIEEYISMLKKTFDSLSLSYFHSNGEKEIIDFLQNLMNEHCGIIINPGALTHSSIALRDTLLAIRKPCIEVHLSDIYSREKFRHQSFIREVCITSIMGKGFEGYQDALKILSEYLRIEG